MLIEVTGTFCVSNIRFLRKEYSLSRLALANLICISSGMLKKIEEGQTTAVFSRWELRCICDVFDVTVEDLLHKDFSS